METKYITIPFDIERAKRIANGKEEGKIVTRDGRNVRIVCFDVKNEDSILALIKSKVGTETIGSYQSTGQYYAEEQHDNDLMLSVPEWTNFKNGDVVTMGWEEKPRGRYCKWISIIKSIDFYDDEIFTKEYVSVCLEAGKIDSFDVDFDDYSDAAKWARKPTDEEMQTLIVTLLKNQDPRAKECLKRFLDIEIKAYKIEPKDWVLTRESSEDVITIIVLAAGTMSAYPTTTRQSILSEQQPFGMNIQIFRNPEHIKTSMIDVDKLKEENKR